MNALDIHPVLVVDFGTQYTQLIAYRVCETNVYSEVTPRTMSVADMLAKEPATIILSDGPSSVYEEGAPLVDPTVFEVDVPVLGICYGFQTAARALGGTIGRTGAREYGHTETTVVGDFCLFGGAPGDQIVWVSHGDIVQGTFEGFTVTTSTTETLVAAFKSRERRFYGLQWHPGVGHSQFDQDALKSFLYKGADPESTWTTGSIIGEQTAKIRGRVGGAQIICALSGSVDFSVTAALVHRAIGDQLTCLFIDHDLLRVGGHEQVENDYTCGMGTRVITCDESERFLSVLADVTEPETKRKTTGREFIHFFEVAQKRVIEEVGVAGSEAKFLVQGTLYPDVVESGGGEDAINIRSHHNVGGLSEDMTFELVEPLCTLFKDEVCVASRELGLPDYLVSHQPFPDPGLGIRIIGEVTRERLDILRVANLIVHEELTVTGLDQGTWQCPVVLLVDARSVGVQGDGRIYGHPIVLRPVSSEDVMTADWTRLPYNVLARISTRITNSVPEVNRVVLGVISKPPATIEWE